MRYINLFGINFIMYICSKSNKMTLRKIIEIPLNHQLIISLPENFRSKKKVLVTVDEIPEEKTNKMDLMLKASKDLLYLSDMNEVNKDFDHLAGEVEHLAR